MIQIDMEMPDKCIDCRFCVGCKCVAIRIDYDGKKLDVHSLHIKPDWCPLKEVSTNYMNGFTRPTRNIWEKSQ